MPLEGKRISELTEVSRVNKSSKLPIDTGGEEALSITLENLMESGVNAAIEALQFITWVDVLPPTGSTKYLYAVPREEVDKDGKKIAALYLWDGTEWRGAGAFSLNIDPDTLATKDELAGYLPLTGGKLSGLLYGVRFYSDRYSFDNGSNVAVKSNPFFMLGDDSNILVLNTKDERIRFRKQSTGNNQYYILSELDKAVANGVASLDANTKVPSEQIPVATTSTPGGVKPDGTTITVAEDGTLNANTDTLATKDELAGYLPLTGGTLSGQLRIEKNTLFLTSSDNSKYVNISIGKDGFVYFSTKVYLPSNSVINGSKILGADDKAVANGVASLDENAKVPENQLPDSVTNQAILREW